MWNLVPNNIYLFKVVNKNTRKKSEICLKLTIKTPERSHSGRFNVFIVNFRHVSDFFPSVSIVDFEQVNVRLCILYFKQILTLQDFTRL